MGSCLNAAKDNQMGVIVPITSTVTSNQIGDNAMDAPNPLTSTQTEQVAITSEQSSEDAHDSDEESEVSQHEITRTTINSSVNDHQFCWQNLSNPIESLDLEKKIQFLKLPIIRSEREVILPMGNIFLLWLVKYNPGTDTFTKYMEFYDKHGNNPSLINIDDKKENIYTSSLHKISLITKTKTELKPKDFLLQLRYAAYATKAIIINDRFLHSFCDSETEVNGMYGIGVPKHAIHDIVTGQTLKQSQKVRCFPFNTRYDYYSMVHSKSQMKVLFMGGAYSDRFTIVVYDIKQDIWKRFRDIQLGGASDKLCCTVTKDGNFVIIIHGYSKVNEMDIFDIQNETIETVHIDCPFDVRGRDSKQMFTVYDENEILFNGFLRRYCYLMDKNLPIDLIKLMAEFYKEEFLHVIQCTGEHWKISLSGMLGKCRFKKF